MLFAEAVQSERLRSGQSQRELADRLGVRQQTVSRWEAGTALPPPRRVADLERELDLERGTLLRLAGYLDPVESSPLADQIRQLLPQMNRLSDRELVLLIDTAWQIYRNRHGFAPSNQLETEPE